MVRTRAVAKFQSYKERTLGPVTTSRDPGRRFRTAGTLPRNKLALRFGRTAFAVARLCVRAGLTVMAAAAFGHDHG